VDELTVAISHMQENLRDLVAAHPEHQPAVRTPPTRCSFDRQRHASAEEIKESMDRIAKGADEQLGLVSGRAG